MVRPRSVDVVGGGAARLHSGYAWLLGGFLVGFVAGLLVGFFVGFFVGFIAGLLVGFLVGFIAGLLVGGWAAGSSRWREAMVLSRLLRKKSGAADQPRGQRKQQNSF